jgi:hypothetical protein
MSDVTKFQMLAAIVKQDRFYNEFDDAQPFGNVLIEILRKLHAYHDVHGMNVRSLADIVFEEIAEEFRYAIGNWDEHGNDYDAEPADRPAGTVLDAVQATLDEARKGGQATPTPDESLPPTLDIPS